jgi:hypothetical protein
MINNALFFSIHCAKYKNIFDVGCYRLLNTKEKKSDVSYPEKLFQMRRNLIHEAKQQQHRHPIVLHAISKDQLNRLKNKINFFFFYRRNYCRVHCICLRIYLCVCGQ